MGKIHLVLPDPHAHPEHNNRRADWVGKLILDLKPDVVVNLGDMFDMPSMSDYDKGKKSFWGRTYKKDLDAGLEFDDRLWHPIRHAKKRKPFSVVCEGNHEHRLVKAIDLQPELEGVISFKDFNFDRNYNEIVKYDGQTPGFIKIDGIYYAHYFISGRMGYAISGEHPAHALLMKLGVSSTCGHSHLLSFERRVNPEGKPRIGLHAGVYQDYDSEWAGHINRHWWRGVVIKRNVENGNYTPQFVSLEELRTAYG